MSKLNLVINKAPFYSLGPFYKALSNNYKQLKGDKFINYLNSRGNALVFQIYTHLYHMTN